MDSLIAIATIIFVLIGIFLAFTKPKWLLYAVVFFAGWQNLFIDVGLMITAYRLIVIIFLLYLPIHLSLRKSAIKIPPSVNYLLFFVYYAIIISLIAQFYSPESHIADFARGEGRWIFQIAMLLIDITPAFLPLLFLTKIEDIKTAGKVFIASTAILCILGWIQILLFYLYRIAIFPIPREGLLGDIGQIIAVDMLGVTFYRMHSLGGEPKDFAITVAVAIILLIIYRIVNPEGFRFRNLLLGFFLISLFMSFSTSGFFVLVIGLALLVILPLFVKGLRFSFIFRPIAVIVTATIISFVIITSSGILSPDVLEEVIIERTIGRSPIEIFDAAALDFLADYPQYGLFGVGMGNTHLYSRDYLADWARPFAYDAVFIPNSGVFRILIELGIVGIILFLCVYLIPIRSLFRQLRYTQDNTIKRIGLTPAFFGIFILIVYLMRVHQINFAFITLGLLYFLNRVVLCFENYNEKNFKDKYSL